MILYIWLSNVAENEFVSMQSFPVCIATRLEAFMVDSIFENQADESVFYIFEIQELSCIFCLFQNGNIHFAGGESASSIMGLDIASRQKIETWSQYFLEGAVFEQ